MSRAGFEGSARVVSLAALCFVLVAAAGEVHIEVEEGVRIVRSNGLPSHEPGRFPNAGNPNRITEQRHEWRMSVKPRRAARTTALELGPFGVALNGIAFDPGAAEWWRGDRNSGWQVEALGPGIDLGLDAHHAHVQPNGSYHYHGIPTGLFEELGVDGSAMVQVGWAADGFALYAGFGPVDALDPNSPIAPLDSSYRIRSGERPSGQQGPGGSYDGTYVQDHEYVAGAGDLDACNGRFGITPEHPEGTYGYFLTETYPVVPRCFVGTPDESFRHGPRRGSRRGPPGGQHPPPDHRPPPGRRW